MTKPTDHDLDLSVAAMLRFGVTLASLVVLGGGILSMRQLWSATPNYRHFQVGGEALRTLPNIWHGAIHFQPKSIIQFGLLLLIATPVARVVFCVMGFARQRNILYVLISSIVLIILGYSLSKGIR